MPVAGIFARHVLSALDADDVTPFCDESVVELLRVFLCRRVSDRIDLSLLALADSDSGLDIHLTNNRPSVTVITIDGKLRLARRQPAGIDDTQEIARVSASTRSGSHLANAITATRSLTPDPSLAMTEAIRAVESAAAAIVAPKDARPQLSKIVSALRDNPAWGLILDRRDDGVPDHRAVLVGMLETLAMAQRDRHASGTAPAIAQADAHVQLAATLVAWFSSGAVVREAS